MLERLRPFLLRSDERSEVLVHIMDLEERSSLRPF